MPEFEDAVEVEPHLVKVLLENHRVRVLEYRGKFGDKGEMHSHPDGFIYHLEGEVKVRSTNPDGQVREVELKPNTVIWMPATEHTFELIEGDKCRGLHIELK